MHSASWNTRSGGEPAGRRWRVALYSHDTMGLGHMRRNLLIAQTLARPPLCASVLLIAGAREASTFAMPPGVDCLTLPALRKVANGHYQSRSLGVGVGEIIALRTGTIRAAVEAFAPDVFIADNVPRGAQGELDPALEYLRRKTDARCVLGLRDVLDDPETVRDEWARAGNEEVIREFYDAVWVYGDRAVNDLARAYQFSPGLASKVSYTGYFDQRKRLEWSLQSGAWRQPMPALPRARRLALCAVGGGEDGRSLAEAFAAAELPDDFGGLILMGPFMPAEARGRLLRLASKNPRLEVVKSAPEPTRLLMAADRVVSMGGYNTVSEVLSFEKRALVVPRTTPRREQLIRAERLHALGLLDWVRPEEASPERLGEWLAREDYAKPPVRERLDMNGLERLPGLLEAVIAGGGVRGRVNENEWEESELHHVA